MNTASKLAQLARASQKKTTSNTCRVCGGIGLPSKGIMNYHNIQHPLGKSKAEFETVVENCLKCESCGHSWIPSKIDNSFQQKVKWGSHQYVRFVKERCKELASKGYGSVEIKIDKTTDLFNVDENRNSCYSADFVFTLLNNEGFTWKNEPVDYYDAISDVLIWDANLSQAPNSEKIGMCWK